MARPVFNRPDTLFGVCEAIGQDVGINADWLRVALAFSIFWNPWATAAAYIGLGVAVFVARLVTPERPAVAAQTPPPSEASNDDDEGTIMLAEAA